MRFLITFFGIKLPDLVTLIHNTGNYSQKWTLSIIWPIYVESALAFMSNQFAAECSNFFYSTVHTVNNIWTEVARKFKFWGNRGRHCRLGEHRIGPKNIEMRPTLEWERPWHSCWLGGWQTPVSIGRWRKYRGVVSNYQLSNDHLKEVEKLRVWVVPRPHPSRLRVGSSDHVWRLLGDPASSVCGHDSHTLFCAVATVIWLDSFLVWLQRIIGQQSAVVVMQW